MPIDSISSSVAAMMGMQRGWDGVNRAASEVALQVNAPQESSASNDYSRSLLDMQRYSYQTQASARVVETENAMMGRLIDVRA